MRTETLTCDQTAYRFEEWEWPFFPVANVGTIKCPVTDQAANGVMGSETLALDGGQFVAPLHDLYPGRGLAVYMGQHAEW